MATLALLMVPVVGALLYANYAHSRRLEWLAKPLASALFILAAVRAGAFASAYGVAVLVALVFAWWGDVLLIPRTPRTFLLGLAAFLLGHVGYVVAFVVRGVDGWWALASAAVMAVPTALVTRWLLPSVPARMKGPVVVYASVITLMVGFAVGAWRAGGNALIPLGALMFYASDFSVARERFVAPGFVNRAWGLPLYYAAQLVLASTVGDMP